MKLGELAQALELQLHGDALKEVNSLAPVASASANDLTFVVSADYLDVLKASQAGAIILPQTLLADAPGNALVSSNPYVSYARASWLLSPDLKPPVGVQLMAVVGSDTEVSKTASVAATVVIGSGVCIGDDVVIGERCVIGDNVVIGKGSRLFASVTVYHGCSLGERCRVQSGAVIGSEGFGFAYDAGWLPIHQTGCVRIGNDVHIGANTTIDRGAMDDTVISDGVILDNQIQIAHNVKIGEHTAIAGCVGVAGSTQIGAKCQIGGACNIVGHLKITDSVVLNATSFVTKSITEPGRYGSGMPLQNITRWRRTFAAMGHLDELLKRVRRLERQQK